MPKADDTAAKDEVVAGTTTTDSAPVETNESVEAEDDGLSAVADIPLDSNDRQELETDSKTEQLDADETKSDEQPKDDKTPSPEDEWNNLKGSSQDRFRQTINERNELRQKKAELEAKMAQFATEQDLVNETNPETGEYYTPQEIERISWLQSREAQAERANQELYATQVHDNQLAINEEAVQVTKDFPLLDPNSKDYVPEIGTHYVEALNDSLIYVLPDGQQTNRSTLLANNINPETQATLVGYSTSPHKLAKLAADAFNRAKAQGETLGQAKAQKANEKMLANVDVPSGVPGKSSGDELDDLFDKVKDISLA